MVFSSAHSLNLQGAFSSEAQRSALIILLLTQGSNIFPGGGKNKEYDLPGIIL